MCGLGLFVVKERKDNEGTVTAADLLIQEFMSYLHNLSPVVVACVDYFFVFNGRRGAHECRRRLTNSGLAGPSPETLGNSGMHNVLPERTMWAA